MEETMKCPHCQEDTIVTEKRGSARRRLCRAGHKFTTDEVVTERFQFTYPNRPRKRAKKDKQAWLKKVMKTLEN